MTNQPIQIVLNPSELRARRERQGGGSGKDFFANDDRGFQRHREGLESSVREIEQVLTTSAQSPTGLGFVVVEMRGDALAKSHRPQDALFKATLSPHSATENIGQPVFAVTPRDLEAVAAEISRAEDTVEVREDAAGVPRPRPTPQRTETSAIASVRLWGEADKRNFGAAEAVEWISASGTTAAQYQVELFSTARVTEAPRVAEAWRTELRRLVESLKGLGVIASRARGPQQGGAGTRLALGVLEAQSASVLSLKKLPEEIERQDSRFDRPLSLDRLRHQEVLEVLTASPVVRRVELMPRVSAMDVPALTLGSDVPAEIFEVVEGEIPKIGVIDCGIEGPILAWVEEDRSYVAPADRDGTHGTFIAGLLVAAGDLNTYFGDYPRGCRLFDIAVLPADPGNTGIPFDNYYPDGIPGFMDEVESAVEYFQSTQGVRVFTFSINVEGAPGQTDYGYIAQRLDAISDRLDVIIVISAGNLDSVSQRDEWPASIPAALAELARDRQGFLAQPGESLFNVSVSALNPPGLPGQVPMALARYSRRGPGLRGAVKPDFAHVGGSGSPTAELGSGLFSIDTDGHLAAAAGTSFAGPLVARRIAELDASIESAVSRETLLALTVHNATTPSHLRTPDLRAIARDIVGFGVPAAPSRVLEADDSGITLVVQTRLMPRQEHKLEFAWPESLVRDGKCRGYARITLVARPVLAYQHGDERVRVNIDAKLMQLQADGTFKGKLSSVFLSDDPPRTTHVNERELLLESMKWQVVKSSQMSIPRGHGPTSRWKLLVEYLTRAGENYPTGGVEYALVLEIRDLDGVAPVFQEMRAQLTTLGIQTSDIRTRARARAQA